MEAQNLDLEFPKSSFEVQKTKGVFRARNLKFDSEACVTKCVVQLLLIGVVKDIVENFLSQLTDEVWIFKANSPLFIKKKIPFLIKEHFNPINLHGNCT